MARMALDQDLAEVVAGLAAVEAEARRRDAQRPQEGHVRLAEVPPRLSHVDALPDLAGAAAGEHAGHLLVAVLEALAVLGRPEDERAIEDRRAGRVDGALELAEERGERLHLVQGHVVDRLPVAGVTG